MLRKAKDRDALQRDNNNLKLIEQFSLEQLAYEEKYISAREFLGKLIDKFSRMVDASIFKELDRINVNLNATFISQRNVGHLVKLAYSIFFIRRKLSRNMNLLPFKEYLDIRTFPSFLYFTFGFKPVLSILTHTYLKDKYEIFDEEQILFIIRKLIPEAELVKDSVYTFHPSKNAVKTLYCEINKKSGFSFDTEEIKEVKELLKQEIKSCIEQLVPRVFMIRNEEEILKNILTLSREIHVASDLPQVMILFDQQTSHEATFTIILVRVLKPNYPTLQECFSQVQLPHVEYLPERCQIVRYLRKKHPIEANLFRMKLVKDPSLLRVDMSLNFYLARQKISDSLMDAIGEFRDYNGGIIIKQREALASFRETFHELSLKEPDLLENFYYSLSPIEAQPTILLEHLKIFFELFLEARNFNFTRPSDSFFKFERQNGQLFMVIRIPDKNFKMHIDSIFSSFIAIQKVISFNITAQNTYFLGYFLVDADEEIEEQICQSIANVLKNWESAIGSHQIFKLSLEHPVVSLDPRVGGDGASALILKMLFEGLMRMDKQGQLENGVAQQITISFDQKTYLFQLHPKRLWSDGSTVSAYDFEYAWKKVLSPTFKTPFAYLFYPIKNAKLAKSGAVSSDAIGVKAIGPLTLKVELEFPSPYFLELTAHTIYSPVNRLTDQTHPNWPFEDKGNYICNGAFQLKKKRS